MYFDGTKEVTRQDIRNIYKEELTRQGAKEMWTLRPHDFEEREACPTVVIVTDNDFDLSKLNACYDNEDYTTYLCGFVTSDVNKFKNMFYNLICVYQGGDWVDAD